MKFFIPLFLIALMCISFIPKVNTTAYAGEEESDKTVEAILDGTDIMDIEQYIEKLREENGMDGIETAKEMIRGILYQTSDVDPEYFIKIFFTLLTGDISGYLAQMSVIVLVCLLLSLLKNISSDFAARSTEKIVYIACYGVIVSIVLSMLTVIVTETVRTMNMLSTFTEAVFPPLLVLMTAIGAPSASSVYQPMLAFFSTSVIAVINKIILPIFYLCIVLTVVGHLNEEIKLEKFMKTAKSAAEWLLSFFFGLFTTVASARGIAASGADSLAIRSTKNALSGAIPVVGNYVKDGFDIVVASCVVIKNAVGVTAIILLIMTVLVPIAKTVLLMFALKLTASVTEPFGQNGISNMLFDLADCLKLLVLLLICTAFTLFVLLMLVVLSCNRGVV